MQFTLPLLTLIGGLTLSGCAATRQGSYVIVGMDYGDVKAILSTKDSTNKYVERVRRNPCGDKLIVTYVLLDDAKEERTALITTDALTITRPSKVTEVEHQVDRKSVV